MLLGDERGRSEMEKVGLRLRETDGKAMFPGTGGRRYTCVGEEQPAWFNGSRVKSAGLPYRSTRASRPTTLLMRWFPLCKEAMIIVVFEVRPDMVELKGR
jgi:hypothetical protein